MRKITAALAMIFIGAAVLPISAEAQANSG
jgi:hypothetical protein